LKAFAIHLNFRRLLISIVRILLGVYLGLGLILYFMQPGFTFQPTKELTYKPSDIGLEYENVQLKTPDNLLLSAWYIPAKNARFTLLFCCGNGGNISDRLVNINIFNKLEVNCLIFNYRGYGNSGGKPSEKGLYIDAQTAYDWLINEKKISPENMIIYGQSLGGSVAAYLASNVKAKGLIIESCFTSFADIAKKYYPYMPIKLLAKYSFKTIDYLKKVKCPVLIIHSRNDEIVPFEFGLRLYKEAAKEPKEFIEISGSHNEGFIYSGQIYREGLSNWLNFIENYPQQTAAK
jgi:fermentation-respiration switch protein FrsA (DUF1100 family)